MTWPRVYGLYGAAAGFAGAVGAAVLAALAGGADQPAFALVVLAAPTVVISLGTTVPGAVATAVQAWALYAGFLVGRAGSLVLDDRTWFALAVLLVAAVVASAVGGTVRVLTVHSRTRAPVAVLRDHAPVNAPR